jgi:hypothetical protein
MPNNYQDDVTVDIRYSHRFNVALSRMPNDQQVRVLTVLHEWLRETRQQTIKSFDKYGTAYAVIEAEGTLGRVRLVAKVSNHLWLDYVFGRNGVTRRKYLYVVNCQEF